MVEAVKKAAGKSWVTTAIGICGAVGLVCGALAAQFDKDPLTIANWAEVIPAALAIFGVGVASRDHNVSSEEAGLK